MHLRKGVYDAQTVRKVDLAAVPQLVPRDELLRATVQMECVFPYQDAARGIVTWVIDGGPISDADLKIALLCFHYARIISIVERNHTQAVYDHIGRIALDLASGGGVADGLTLHLKLSGMFGLVRTNLRIDPWVLRPPTDSIHTYVARLSVTRPPNVQFWYDLTLGVHQSKIFTPGSLFIMLRQVASEVETPDKRRLGMALGGMNETYRKRDVPMRSIRGQDQVANDGCLAVGISPRRFGEPVL